MRAFVGALITLSIAGCAHFNDPEVQARVVRHRAAFDFECSEAELEVLHMGGDIYGVRGCGKKASYDASGPCSKEGNCSASRQGEVQSGPASSSAPAASAP